MVLARMNEPRPWRPLIPPEQLPQHQGKPTLVLDLNHTLVSGCLSKYDFIAQDPVSGALMPTLKRPYVDEFLSSMSKIFEMIAFTSCEKHLADPILDKLDPKGDLFAYRLFYDSCTIVPEQLKPVKDLSMLGRGLERVMIIDDSASKSILNPHNWIPISAFYDDPNDRELVNIIPFLKSIAKMEDVRDAIRERQRLWIRKRKTQDA